MCIVICSFCRAKSERTDDVKCATCCAAVMKKLAELRCPCSPLSFVRAFRAWSNHGTILNCTYVRHWITEEVESWSPRSYAHV